MNNNIKYFQEELVYNTSGQSLYNITELIVSWINSKKITKGQLTIFLKHTSASLIIQENASKDVLMDIQKFFHKLIPQKPSLYIHTLEGKDDMPAHLKTILTQTSLTIPIINRKLNLRNLNNMRKWDVCLKEYLDENFSNYYL